MKHSLFVQVTTGTRFTFGDKPERVLIKSGDGRFLVPYDGEKPCHPHVLVFPKQEEARKSIYDRRQE